VTVAEPLQPRLNRLAREGERNWVLNLNELAVQAMRLGDRELAARALSESLLHINAVFGTTVEAERARQVFFSEDVKLFKGEPYERAMAFLYRGLLYMQEGDYENARACFRSGILQDAFAEEEQFRADWSIFDYLIARCEMELGRFGFDEESWLRAQRIHSTFPDNYRTVVGNGPATLTGNLPPLDPTHNLLIVAQQGSGPVKVKTGRYGQFLAVRRGPIAGTPATVQINGVQAPTALIDSVFFQATTRGGRPFDGIAKRKVIFKDVTGVVGELGAWTAINILAHADNEGAAVAGLVVLGVSVVAIALYALTKPQADTRQWSSLPDTISIYTGSHPAGVHALAVSEGSWTAQGVVPLIEPGRGLTVVVSFQGPDKVLLIPESPTPRRIP
jgi:tetratricopeptide (TPR) repeat protein